MTFWPRRSFERSALFTPAAFVALVCATACDRSATKSGDALASSASGALLSLPLAPPPPSILSPSPQLPSFAAIVKRVDPGVVTISTVLEGRAPGGEIGPLPRGKRRSGKGLGTGFVVDSDGLVLTNSHVIESNQITVKLSDDREFIARIVGRDPRTDVAVLKIDAKDLTPIPFGDSDAVEVGDWVLAIGNPFGLSHTVNAGIVSAKGRTREDVPLDPAGYYDFLQTDASINPGNSGGPLLDLKGQVVGMNTAIRGGGAQGIGFAIPINMVKQLLPKLVRDGKLVRSALGVRIRDVRDLTPEQRGQLKIGVEARGVLVDSVEPSGPAAKAGLRPGDIVLQFQDEPIERSAHLQWLASTAGVGQIVTLRIAREGVPKELKVTLGELPEPKKGEP